MSEARQASTPPGVGLTDVVFEQAAIARRVSELAEEIRSDFQGGELCVVGLLSGGLTFTCDLIRQLRLPLRLDFVALNRFRPTAKARLTQRLQMAVEGRPVLVVDDLVETGLTLRLVVNEMKRSNPASLATCALLERPELRLADLSLEYVGFQAPEELLVGYGLDYRGSYRDLPYIAALQDQAVNGASGR